MWAKIGFVDLNWICDHFDHINLKNGQNSCECLVFKYRENLLFVEFQINIITDKWTQTLEFGSFFVDLFVGIVKEIIMSVHHFAS